MGHAILKHIEKYYFQHKEKAHPGNSIIHVYLVFVVD